MAIPTEMQRVVLAARPQGEPKLSDFRVETVPMPKPGEGEFLARTIWLSLDPYMRGRMDESKSYAAAVEIDAPMESGTVGEVIASKGSQKSFLIQISRDPAKFRNVLGL